MEGNNNGEIMTGFATNMVQNMKTKCFLFQHVFYRVESSYSMSSPLIKNDFSSFILYKNDSIILWHNPFFICF